MKYKFFFLSLLSIFLFVSCASSGAPARDADQIVMDFAQGLEDQDIDLLMSAYHEDVDFDGGDPQFMFMGKEAVRSMQEEGFNGPSPMVHTEDWKKSEKGSAYVYELVVQFGDVISFLNILEIQKMNGEWGIIFQSVYPIDE